MKISEQVISKGRYNHSAPTDPILVTQYVLIRQRGRKCLLLRFKNNFEFTINKMSFEIVQKDKHGKEIGRTVIKTPPINEAPGAVFTLFDGFEIGNECVDFRINFLSFRSGDYKYTFKKCDIEISFEPDRIGQPVALAETCDKKKDVVSYIRSRKMLSFGFAAFISCVAVLALLATVLFSYFGG